MARTVPPSSPWSAWAVVGAVTLLLASGAGAAEEVRVIRAATHKNEVTKPVIKSSRCSGVNGTKPAQTITATFTGSKPGRLLKRVDTAPRWDLSVRAAIRAGSWHSREMAESVVAGVAAKLSRPVLLYSGG